jgi:o-succinylbenzoate synthase
MPETVKLDSIRLTHVRVPLREPFKISNGVVSEKDGILVEVSARGQVGLGEASPMSGSFYSHHTPDSSWDVLTKQIVPRMTEAGELSLSGKWFTAVGLHQDDPFATCGVDGALCDLAARLQGVPLWRLLGGRGDRPIESGLAVGIYPTTGELLQQIEEHLRTGGYKRVKIKVQPGWDIEPLEAVRIRFPDVPLMVDANCAYDVTDIPHICSWDQFKLIMIEQPLPRGDLEGHAELSRLSDTPICLDESAESVASVERAISLKSAKIVNIKLQRLGSMSAAVKVHKLTAAAKIGCWMGTMPELGVGAYAAMHFATLPNIVYPTDVEASDRWFAADVTTPPVTCQKGLLKLPTGPGLGVALNREVMTKYKVREWSSPLECTLRY